jgi:hypothetical protein
MVLSVSSKNVGRLPMMPLVAMLRCRFRIVEPENLSENQSIEQRGNRLAELEGFDCYKFDYSRFFGPRKTSVSY